MHGRSGSSTKGGEKSVAEEHFLATFFQGLGADVLCIGPRLAQMDIVHCPRNRNKTGEMAGMAPNIAAELTKLCAPGGKPPQC
jgi:hypothetical protein